MITLPVLGLAGACGSRSTTSGGLTSIRLTGTLVYSDSIGPNPVNTVVWRANADGSHRVRVNKGMDPTISPNGRFVTFIRLPCTSTTCGDLQLFVAPTSDRKAERIANAASAPPALAWAPDSQRLAAEAEGGIYVFDLQTGTGTLIAKGRLVGSPSFSPNSRFVVYERDRHSPILHNGSNLASDLYVADLKSGRSRRITRLGDAGAPLWGPSEIAFSHNQEIWLIDQNGSHMHRLADEQSTAYGWPAVWSSDGKKLLLSVIEFRGKGKFRAIEVPSGRVSFTGSGNPLGLSRDGKVALIADCASGITGAFGRVETVPLGGGRARAVVPSKRICQASWNA